MTKVKLKQFIESLGLTTYGFIPLRRFDELISFYQMRKEKKLQNEFEEDEIEKRVNPLLYMQDGKTIISIAFPYRQQENICSNGFSLYTKGKDYHKVVRKYLNQICEFLTQNGYQAEAFVDSNALPERYIAYLSGVGFIGRNNMIITKQYGSFVFLGEIITNLAIDCKDMREVTEIASYAECKECRICYGECPTKSINEGKINPNICLSYYTQKKELSNQEIKLIRENVFGCDYCQLKCPYNKEVAQTGLEDFKQIKEMNEKIETYAGMDNKFFKEKISGSSCGWRGKNVLRRNAIIQLAKQGKEIEQYQGDSSYINEYIKRLKEMEH